MQYATLKNRIEFVVDSTGQQRVTLPVDLFHRIFAAALAYRSGFDESFYLSKYPDVRAAVSNGTIASGADHYTLTGYFENRFPYKIIVDEGYYLDTNPDVADAVRSGTVKSAQSHFDSSGFMEGRSPHKDFSLL